MDENGLTQRPIIIIKFQYNVNKEKSYILQREKTGIKVSNNLLPIHSFSRNCWRKCSTKARVNQEREGLWIQEPGIPGKREKPAVYQMPRASGPGHSQINRKPCKSTENLVSLNIQKRCRALGKSLKSLPHLK